MIYLTISFKKNKTFIYYFYFYNKKKIFNKNKKTIIKSLLENYFLPFSFNFFSNSSNLQNNNLISFSA